MHPSALKSCNMFFETYVKNKIHNPKVLNIGSKDNHEEKFKYIPDYATHIGVDFTPGPNVDIVLDDPYKFPIEDSSIDVIISTSVFEHCEFFWLTILEMYRILKPGGLIYINAPSNGSYHLFPVDCWRFYPNAAEAFVNWGKRNGYNPYMLECYIDQQQDFPRSIWSDFVCVILKDADKKDLYKNRILHRYKNVWYSKIEDSNYHWSCSYTEDQSRIFSLYFDFKDELTINNFIPKDIDYISKLKWV